MGTKNLIMSGRVVRDPEISESQNGNLIAKLLLRTKTVGMEKAYEDFFQIKCFGKVAAFVRSNIESGSLVDFEVALRSYNFGDGNNPRYGVELIGQSVFLK